MKKRKPLFGAIAAAAIAAGALTGSVLGTFDGAAPLQRKQEPAAREAFTLKVRDGKIAVFMGGDMESPAAETDIPVSGLREYDRGLLEEGIEAGSYEEVLALLEDFGP